MCRYFYLVSLLIVLQGIAGNKVFLSHDQTKDQQQIFKFFYDKNDGYYVDIGGYDPIFISNSLNLYARGWDGLNIEAHPVRFSAFPQIKSEDVSINIAGDETQKYVTFYQFEQDVSQSTTILDVSENLKRTGKITTLQIPAMNMKQLCQRYFKKKPNYMNIDIQGVTTKLLKSNDWNNPKCRPQVMIPEQDNIPNGINKKNVWTVSHKEFLEQNGYTFVQEYYFNEIFIENSVYQYYMDKYKNGTQVLASMNIVYSKQQLINFYRAVGSPDIYKFTPVTYRSDIHNGFFYYFYPKQGSIFCLEDINRRSNRFATKKNRPILIQMFNPQNTHYIINSKQYTREDVVVNNLVYDKITITKQNGQTFVTYIFNIDTQAYKAYVAKNKNQIENKSQKPNIENQIKSQSKTTDQTKNNITVPIPVKPDEPTPAPAPAPIPVKPDEPIPTPISVKPDQSTPTPTPIPNPNPNPIPPQPNNQKKDSQMQNTQKPNNQNQTTPTNLNSQKQVSSSKNSATTIKQNPGDKILAIECDKEIQNIQNIKLLFTILISAVISATLTYIILRRKFKKMQKQINYANTQQQMSAHEAN